VSETQKKAGHQEEQDVTVLGAYCSHKSHEWRAGSRGWETPTWGEWTAKRTRESVLVAEVEHICALFCLELHEDTGKK
jgi:hypothetical protein